MQKNDNAIAAIVIFVIVMLILSLGAQIQENAKLRSQHAEAVEGYEDRIAALEEKVEEQRKSIEEQEDYIMYLEEELDKE